MDIIFVPLYCISAILMFIGSFHISYDTKIERGNFLLAAGSIIPFLNTVGAFVYIAFLVERLLTKRP